MDLHYQYDGTDNHMDSRDIEEDIHTLIRGGGEQTGLFVDLVNLRDDSERASEGWLDGIQFVRAEYADGDWAKERAADFGVFQAVLSDEGYGAPKRSYWERMEEAARQWPFAHIDWDAAADALHEDAQEFEFRGVTYFEN